MTQGVFICDYKKYTDVKHIKHIDTIIIMTLDCQFITNVEAFGYDYMNDKSKVKVIIFEFNDI